MKEEAEASPTQEDRSTLISLCCEAKILELRKQLELPQFKQLVCAPLQFRDFQNETILHYMCAYTFEELDVVHELLDHGAVACINMGPVPPLAYAAQRNHKAVVRLLLAHGAQPEPAMAYAVNPDILQMLKKKVHDNRREPAKKPKDSSNESKQQEAQLNKVSLAVSKHMSSLFSSVESSEIHKVSDHLAKATSFSGIVSAYQMLCDLCKPEGEKATGEFVVSALLLPWGLPSLARHVAIDRQGQANRIAEAMFGGLPAYWIAVYVESKLAIFEKDRPRSSFPHLYVTLVNAMVDAIITSLIGNTIHTSSDVMIRSTSKLLKWMSAVGFASVNNAPDPSSSLKQRLQAKSLLLACRYLCIRTDTPDVSPTINYQDINPSPPYSYSSNTQILSNLSSSPSSSSPSPSLHTSDDSPSSSPLLPNIPSSTSPSSTRSSSPQSDPSTSPLSGSPSLSRRQATSPQRTRSTSPSQPVSPRQYRFAVQTTTPGQSTSPDSPVVTHFYSAARPVTPPQAIPSSLIRTITPPLLSSPIIVTAPTIIPSIPPHLSTTVAPITVTAPTFMSPVIPPSTSTLAYPIAITPPMIISPPQPVRTPHTPSTPTTQSSAYLITIRLDYPNLGDISAKMYNTTALSVLHDKISARLKSRLAAQIAALGWAENLETSTKSNEFVFESSAGRRIAVNEPGVIGDLEHPHNIITLRVVNK